MSIYLGNLAPEVDASLLRELVAQIAPPANVRLPRSKATNRPQGFAFVDFTDNEDAEYVYKVLSKIKLELFGRPLKTNWASKSINQTVAAEKRGTKEVRLFIGNLNSQLVRYDSLMQPLSRFGKVNNINIPLDSNGVAKGYAFISIEPNQPIDKVVAELDGEYILGKRCKVQLDRSG